MLPYLLREVSFFGRKLAVKPTNFQTNPMGRQPKIQAGTGWNFPLP